MDDVRQRGDPPSALRRLGAAVRLHPVEPLPADRRPLLSHAHSYALAGDHREAKRWLARYDTDATDPARLFGERPQRSGAAAMIAVLERRWGDASREVDIAGRDVDGEPLAASTAARFDSGYGYAAAWQVAPAIASFEHFLTTRDLARLVRVDAERLAFTLQRLGAL